MQKKSKHSSFIFIIYLYLYKTLLVGHNMSFVAVVFSPVNQEPRAQLLHTSKTTQVINSGSESQV